ncbi:MAG TPA: DNA repair exonuclease [Clostridiaceae bacterium]|nr:DNA repair exonuclease [Clostridiaceae bacterium]
MRVLKFLHCADIHLDAPFTSLANAAGKSSERRQDLRQVFIKIIDVAQNENVDILLISGDLYEHDYVKKSTIYFVNDQFNRIPDVEVFIVPGNHDPYVAGSYYRNFSFADNVHILTQEKPCFEAAGLGVCVYGLGFMDFYSEKPFTGQLKPVDKQAINILMVHGTLDMNIGNDVYNPVSSGELERLGMDYIAFGHFHNRFEGLGRSQNIYNPGSPEPLGFDEEGEHGVLVGTITKDDNGNSYIDTRFIKLNRKFYSSMDVDVSGCGTDEQVIKRIEDTVKGMDTGAGIFCVNLTGYVEQGFNIDLQYVTGYFSNRMFYLKVLNNTAPDYDFSRIAGEPGLKGLFVRKMLSRIENSRDEHEKKILTKALYYGLEALERGEIECL